jgi:hypothetical protein
MARLPGVFVLVLDDFEYTSATDVYRIYRGLSIYRYLEVFSSSGYLAFLEGVGDTISR